MKDAPPPTPPVKFKALSYQETDRLHTLLSDKSLAEIGSQHAQQKLLAYCNMLIDRHKGDRKKHAISGDLQFIIELPQHEQKRVEEILNHAAPPSDDAKPTEPSSDPSNVVEMTQAAKT